MRQRLILLLLSLLFATPAAAESVSCPDSTKSVLLEAGLPQKIMIGKTEILTHNFVQQDIGGDYDEKAAQHEWNFLNLDASTTPAVAHCVVSATPKKTVEVAIPSTITRCIQPQKGAFICESGTLACIGYVDKVRLEAAGKGGVSVALEPSGGDKRWVWKNLRETKKGAHLTVSCSQANLPKIVSKLEIPEDMQECSLVNRRFRCTATPEKHDLFWPEE